MSELLKFYRDEANASGYTWAEVIAWEDGELEAVHDFIQWLFPTDERSRFNPDAPVLDAEDLIVFREPFFQERLRKSAERFRLFYKLGTPATVSKPWAMPFNHNLLRITRIIRSLALLGLPDVASQFRDDAKTAARATQFPLEGSISFWDRAV